MTRPMNTNPLDHAPLKIESQAMNTMSITTFYIIIFEVTFEWLSYTVLIGLNLGLYHSKQSSQLNFIDIRAMIID